MDLYLIEIMNDSVWGVLNEIGELGDLEFIDLNKDKQIFQIRGYDDVKMCDYSACLKIQKACEAEGIKLARPSSYQEFKSEMGKILKEKQKVSGLW